MKRRFTDQKFIDQDRLDWLRKFKEDYNVISDLSMPLTCSKIDEIIRLYEWILLENADDKNEDPRFKVFETDIPRFCAFFYRTSGDNIVRTIAFENFDSVCVDERLKNYSIGTKKIRGLLVPTYAQETYLKMPGIWTPETPYDAIKVNYYPDQNSSQIFTYLENMNLLKKMY